jgi:hypothetical protein
MSVRWFAVPDDWKKRVWEIDFRVGGGEVNAGPRREARPTSSAAAITTSSPTSGSSGSGDPSRAEDPRAAFDRVYTVLDTQAQDDAWLAGPTFTIADCAAAPALFYPPRRPPLGRGVPCGPHALRRVLHRTPLRRPRDRRAPPVPRALPPAVAGVRQRTRTRRVVGGVGWAGSKRLRPGRGRVRIPAARPGRGSGSLRPGPGQWPGTPAAGSPGRVLGASWRSWQAVTPMRRPGRGVFVRHRAQGREEVGLP